MKLQLLIPLFLVATITMHAQVGIGITSPNAGLDISSTTTGLLIPRVSLTSLSIEAPVLNPQGGSIPTSTLIYHDGTNALTAGFYYWDGAKWVLLTTGESNDWTILGNTGTNPTTNFIGTTDTQDFVIRTNNTEKARMTSGGDLGVGTNTPIAKTHITETNTAATNDAVIVDNLGLGSGLTIFETNTANNNTALYVQQDGTGAIARGIDTYMDTANTATGYSLFHNGTGTGASLNLSNAANTNPGLDVRQAGTGRGHYTELTNTTNASTGSSIFHDGIGMGEFLTLTNTANTSTASDIRHAGTGRGLYMDLSNTANASTATLIFHSGTGGGSYTQLSNVANPATGSTIVHSGTGAGNFINLNNATNASTGNTIAHAGTGTGQFITLTNTTSTGTVSNLDHDGLGRGQQVTLNNTTNTDTGISVFHSGTGTGITTQTVGNGIAATVSGTTAIAGSFAITNTAADTNSVGLFANYNGTTNTPAGGGGGNAAEFSHYGTNGNAVDIFMGDPTAGATPSTSEYAALTVSHSAIGTSAAGFSKSAINALNSSADPTITVSNNGTDDGSGVQVFVTPTADANLAATYTQSDDGTGQGIGLFAAGGNIGIIGQSNGGISGVFANGEVGATGAKPFTIDYPLDPENKVLRHFAIESNEVLNMYRGIAKIDASGSAVVNLPEYFDTVNIDVTYQLTPIGSGVQPYITKEQANNQFTIAGAPNSKVSWTIHAKRNDPTIQYYDKKGGKYSSAVRNKKPHEIGKYYTPEAYGKDKTQSIFYNKEREQNNNKRGIAAKKLKAMPKKELKKVTSLENNIQKKNEIEIEIEKRVKAEKALTKKKITEKGIK